MNVDVDPGNRPTPTNLNNLNGKPCPFHPDATVIVAPNQSYALCRGGDYSKIPKCNLKVLTEYAASLNGAAQTATATKPAQTPASESPALSTGQQNRNGAKPAPRPTANGRGLTLPYALDYARHGMKVFPLHEIEAVGECSCARLESGSAGKHLQKDWHTLATVDAEQIYEWWRQRPTANIGVACGPGVQFDRAEVRSAQLEDGGWRSCCPLANERNRTRCEGAT
jgi:bifunctional DNA primase/polymerase-like protein